MGAFNIRDWPNPASSEPCYTCRHEGSGWCKYCSHRTQQVKIAESAASDGEKAMAETGYNVIIVKDTEGE